MENHKTSSLNQLNTYPFKQLTFQVFYQKLPKKDLFKLFNVVDGDIVAWITQHKGEIESHPLFEYYKLISASIYHMGEAPQSWENYYPLILPENEVQ